MVAIPGQRLGGLSVGPFEAHKIRCGSLGDSELLALFFVCATAGANTDFAPSPAAIVVVMSCMC